MHQTAGDGGWSFTSVVFPIQGLGCVVSKRIQSLELFQSTVGQTCLRADWVLLLADNVLFQMLQLFVLSFQCRQVFMAQMMFLS